MLAVLGFSNLAQFGTDTAIAKYTAQCSVGDDLKDKFSAVVTFSYTFVLVTGVLISLIMWLLRYRIALTFEVDRNLAELLPSVFGLMALGILPGFLFSVSRGVLLGLVHNDMVNSLDVGTNIVMWIGALVIGLLGGNAFFLAFLIVIVNFLRFFLGTYLAFRLTSDFNLHFLLDVRIAIEVLEFSFFSWVTSLGGAMFQSLDRLLVGMALGPSAAGVYGIATSIAARLTGLVSKITQVLLPFSSAQEEAGYRQRIVTVLRHSSRLVGCGSLFVSGVLVIWMDEILRLWISSDFAAAYSFSFQLVVVCYGIYGMALPAIQIAQGMGWVAIPAGIYLAGGASMNLLIWVLAPRFGIDGAIVANYILISLLAINFYLAKKLGLAASTVFRDLGIPLSIFLITVSLPFVAISLPLKLLITVALTGTTLWLAFGQNRSRILIRGIKGA